MFVLYTLSNRHDFKRFFQGKCNPWCRSNHYHQWESLQNKCSMIYFTISGSPSLAGAICCALLIVRAWKYYLSNSLLGGENVNNSGTHEKRDTVSTSQSFAPANQVMFHQRILMSRSCQRLQVNLSEAVGLLVFRVTDVNLLRSGLLSSWTSLCCLNTVKPVISVEVLGFYWCLKMLWNCQCTAILVTAYCTVGLGVVGVVGSCGQTCVTEVTAARRSFPPASDDKWPDQTKE